ncbi:MULTISPECIES: glycosyltransferase family 4 protein [unclassified Clostridium]|uniref:glycosyltransferase family 4 protein n=1 Tax=unclassified Clostridium TaxID=2614128 RepID=UPI00029743C4|nr:MULTISPECIES: glycosyltransferase family 4 protein [unclassified Clostridium]EKQ50536.1 MAG: glycosyltransferase [Clostridium sp. Maddingley MBC34-26]
MDVILMHQTITKHDAIGNDINKMYYILKDYGESYVYCDYLFNENLNKVEEDKIDKIINIPDNLIIYHHSSHWKKGEEILKRANCKIIFRYHNITPESFFELYNQEYYEKCKLGREQTDRFIRDYPNNLWMSDSKYNAEDLKEAKNICIVPPFHEIENWKNIKPNEDIMKSLIYSEDVNLLFIGRVVPNKAHLEMIEVVRNYVENYDKNIKLYILGKFDQALEKYTLEINSAIRLYGLEDNIQFIGEVNDNILVSYYLGCDTFLCLSNHEGFCVPVLEAQSLNLPVVAKNMGALGETLGDTQILLGDNICEYAAAIKILKDNTEYKDYVTTNGYVNYRERFNFEINEKAFKKYLKEYIGE